MKKLICLFLKHKVKVIDKACEGEVMKLQCERCNRYFATTKKGEHVSRWTKKHEMLFDLAKLLEACNEHQHKMFNSDTADSDKGTQIH